MKTEDMIRKQYQHEIESKEAYESILMKVKDPTFLYQRIELQDSRIELLDWVLEQGGFKTPLSIKCEDQ